MFFKIIYGGGQWEFWIWFIRGYGYKVCRETGLASALYLEVTSWIEYREIDFMTGVALAYPRADKGSENCNSPFEGVSIKICSLGCERQTFLLKLTLGFRMRVFSHKEAKVAWDSCEWAKNPWRTGQHHPWLGGTFPIVTPCGTEKQVSGRALRQHTTSVWRKPEGLLLEMNKPHGLGQSGKNKTAPQKRNFWSDFMSVSVLPAWMCMYCMDVCALHVCLVSTEIRGRLQITWK